MRRHADKARARRRGDNRAIYALRSQRPRVGLLLWEYDFVSQVGVQGDFRPLFVRYFVTSEPHRSYDALAVIVSLSPLPEPGVTAAVLVKPAPLMHGMLQKEPAAPPVPDVGPERSSSRAPEECNAVVALTLPNN